jgi:ABC-type phosphate/phosphonate transport system substrate-binding protein
MPRTILAVLLVGLSLLAACSPQEITIEVTRLVETQERVEVTRLVPETVVLEETRPVTREVELVIEVTKEPLGTEARPVQLLFPPLYDAETITERGTPLAQALSDATGYEVRVGVLDSEQTVIDLMCAAPADTIGFLSPGGYVLANEQCGVQAGMVAIGDDGLTSKSGMIVVRDDSGIDDLEGVQDKEWAVADQDSLTNYLYFNALLQDEKIEVAETIPVAGESVAMLALFDEEVDLASAEFVPPILPYEERLWDPETDDPEPWRALGLSPYRSGIGYILFNGEPENGGYRVRDARSRIFDVEQEIFNETRIVAMSPPFANDTVAFGPQFPLALARKLAQEMIAFAAGEGCSASLCSSDFYGWNGLALAQDEMYDSIRFVQEELQLTPEEMLALTP